MSKKCWHGNIADECPACEIEDSVSESPSLIGCVRGIEKAKALNGVELFICYLIDNHERDVITEEGLQFIYADFRKWFDAKFETST